MARLTISKKELMLILSYTDEPLSAYLLRKNFLTDDVLDRMDITPQEYRRKKRFNPTETEIIIAVHQITKEEIVAILAEKSSKKVKKGQKSSNRN